MSTHIIDRIAAVKFPKERTGYSDDYYLLVLLGGDNNLIDTESGERARRWNPMAAGQHYHCLARACELAADACGGMVRMVRGRTTPESLIRKVRQALAAAPDYQDPAAVFRITQAAITFTAEEKEKQKYYFDRLVTKRGQPEKRDQVYLRGDVDAFVFSLNEPREAACFIEHLPHQPVLWHHLKIIGPGAN
jgi:hypothetical protein